MELEESADVAASARENVAGEVRVDVTGETLGRLLVGLRERAGVDEAVREAPERELLVGEVGVVGLDRLRRLDLRPLARCEVGADVPGESDLELGAEVAGRRKDAEAAPRVRVRGRQLPIAQPFRSATRAWAASW